MMHRMVSDSIDQPSAKKHELGSGLGCAPLAGGPLLLYCWWKERVLRCYSGGQRGRVWSGPVDDEVLARREWLDDRLDWDGRAQVEDPRVVVRCWRVGVEVRAHCGLICIW